MMSKHVLAEYLKEQLSGKKVIAGVFHTFNFDPEFFENYLLPLFLPDIPFGDNKIQNTILWKKYQKELPPITVYCDFHAKAQRGIHLDYLVRPIDIPRVNGVKPCYHPKHTLLLLEDNELLIITGSNNLTEAGWCSNLEVFNFFKLKPGVWFPREFKDQFKFFNRHIRKKNFNEEFNDETSPSKADNLIDRLLRSVGYTQDSEEFFFDTLTKPDSYLQDLSGLVDYIKSELNNNHPFEKIEILSPYYSKGISLFENLKSITQCDDISLSIPYENTGVVAMDRELFERVASIGFQWKSIIEIKNTKGFRFNHSKIYQFVGNEKVFAVAGSINLTEMAWKGVKNGGNYESAIIYTVPKEKFIPLLEESQLDDLTFSGHKEDEGLSDVREDAFELDFIIDWSMNLLEIINYDEENQHGKMEFDEFPALSINKSREIRLSQDYINYLSNSPVIKVRPSNKSIYLYYYPIHKNIESKPLPAHINLSDSELLNLWMELDKSGDTNTTLQLIDSYIERITNEAGDIQQEKLNNTPSTLNVMATHLNGLLKLQNKIFASGKTNKEKEAISKIRNYYLFAENVDTLRGYRKLISKMVSEEKLNKGFYWFLLNFIDIFFYKKAKNLLTSSELKLSEDIRKELKAEIRLVKDKMVGGKLQEKHLKWTLKMLEDDFK